jgi:flagellar hook-associated protein 1 FlgK
MTVRGLPGFTFDFSDRVDPDPGLLGGSEVGLSGRYTGPGNPSLTLRAVGTGKVGVATGLQVDVLDENGDVLRTLDVGRGYSPGSAIELAPGVTVRFDSGDLTAGDERTLQLISEPDQGGVLAALGLNALFVGGGARDLRIADGLARNPANLAMGRGGRGGDNGVALEVLALRDRTLSTLGASATEYYGLLIGDIGQQRRSTETLRQNEQGLVRAMETRRQEVSGVNVDEEMVDLIRYQRGFEAAARFLSTINEVTELLVSLR